MQRLATLVPRPRLNLIRNDEILPCISPFGSLRGPNPFQTVLSWGTRAERQAPFRDYSGRAEKRKAYLRCARRCAPFLGVCSHQLGPTA